MQVRLTNIVDIETLTTKNFIPSSGLSYLIEFDNTKILFDTGDQRKVLRNNMQLLDINPETIDKVVLSHGHWDHTFGLPEILQAREKAPILEVIAHPNAFKKRRIADLKQRIHGLLKYRTYNLGFPKLSPDLQKRVILKPITEPYK